MNKVYQFTRFMEENVTENIYTHAKANPSYSEAVKSSDEIWEQLKASLTKEQMDLLIEFDSAYGAKISALMNSAYRQGVKDEAFGISVMQQIKES